ncbi:DUF5069 domain-containing protein [Candidatus Nitronereus thalassa]|uniref:DUF5069 domain-containing protein n=1 Tax=Candidatus Nitronereus thalassa TaxID=3020898 RepID=A0ABU3KCE5_9BACT|nr:DUF5069 domain-containing protein [Candidatus Nitronereus thalassa]MDT7043899.1 DUF5069 domain-containing protein [Candidatus Nitronereus thalassa]
MAHIIQNLKPPRYDTQSKDRHMETHMKNTGNWVENLQHLYDEAVTRYQNGLRGRDHVIPQTSLEFLESIGASPQEIYDFVEDWVEDCEPSFSTIADITAIRRDFFLHVQKGYASTHVTDTSTLPSGHEELGGHRWLPRIIAKARAKLRGEMSPDIMYGCGADRPFLHKIGIEPAEFLRIVWKADGDEQAVLDTIKKHV